MNRRPPLSAALLALALSGGFTPILWAVEAIEIDTAAQSASPIALESVSWILAAYRSDKTLVEIGKGIGPARFRFEDGRLSGSAGCNQLTAAYSLDGEKLGFEPGMASTMMACPEALMDQEQRVNAALTATQTYRLDAKLLELLDGEGEPVLRFIAVEPSPLVGQIWQLTGYNNGKHAIVSVLGETQITLELRDDGTLGGSDGCNRYMSGYTLSGETLTIGPVATTRKACPKPEGAAAQAAAYADVLGTVTGYRIENDGLTLLNADGKPAAQFKVEPEPVPEIDGGNTDNA